MTSSASDPTDRFMYTNGREALVALTVLPVEHFLRERIMTNL
jgi:hypothetical protein